MSEAAKQILSEQTPSEPATPPKKRGVTMLPVESSNIQEIGYSPGPAGKLGNLYVKFTTGNTYAYEDVPGDVWQELLDAESKGQYFAAHIRRWYRFHKIKDTL